MTTHVLTLSIDGRRMRHVWDGREKPRKAAGPIPISYIPTSRGPQRHLGNVESPLTSLVRRTSSRRVHRNDNQDINETAQHQQQLLHPQQTLVQPPRIAVQTAGGDTRIYEEDEDDWRSDTYAAYEPSDADSAYDYNYTLSPTQPDLRFYELQKAANLGEAVNTNVYGWTGEEPRSEAGPSTVRALPKPPLSDTQPNDEDGLHPQRMLANLHINVSSPSAGAPPSPLLHGHFTRDSQATASEYSDWGADDSMRSSMQSHLHSRSPSRSRERLSPHSDTGTRNQFPFQSSSPVSPTTSSRYSDYEYFRGEGYEENAYSSNDADQPALRDSWNSTATGATVRRPDYYMPSMVLHQGIGGSTPVVKPVTNFSRPVRESGVLLDAQAVGERVTPQLPPDMRAGKQKVLERNARPMGGNNSSQLETQSTPRPGPQVREVTPASAVYSDYSYYQFSSAAPSPMHGAFPKEGTATLLPPETKKENPPPSGPRTPQDFLQLGIQHHEANRLAESARCFERSAKESGGCGVGMLMYGLTLRHGWGCGKNEKMAFKWLMKAAECAVSDLERMRRDGGDGDAGVVETELVLAIYEVGQCFFHGWGVPKDQKMAVSYYTVAAKLGDGDAQADLGYCLANGKGCKKDKQSAAKWYRAAVQQGQSDLGLGWIYKEKYQ